MPAPTKAQRMRALKGVPLFAGLPDATLRKILDAATEFEAPANWVLVEAKREGSGLFVIEQGSVVVETGGKRIERGPGDFFGELALLTSSAQRTARVRTTTPVRCLAIGRAQFRRLLDSEPKIAVRMLESLAERLAGSISESS